MINRKIHADLLVCSSEPLQVRYPHRKCENLDTQISHSLLKGFFSNLAYMYWATNGFPCVSIRPVSFLINKKYFFMNI